MVATDVLNADILFLYDAKLCNPNGDPDDENKPRMDDLTRRCLVSDVRLKRYLRDYWISKASDRSGSVDASAGNGRVVQDVWVRKGDDGETVSASERVKSLADQFTKETGKEVGSSKPPPEFVTWILARLIDVRLFGATMTIKAGTGESKGASQSITGPVQFNWGYSLHPVELVSSSSITSLFAGRDTADKGDYGTIGKDWRLHYALIGFHGHVSRSRAMASGLQPSDVDYLEDALLHALSEEAVSRSKLGQTPRLYLQIQYKGAAPPLGDPRDYITVESDLPREKFRSVKDYHLNVSGLATKLDSIKDGIAAVRWWSHPDFQVVGDETLKEEKLLGFAEVSRP